MKETKAASDDPVILQLRAPAKINAALAVVGRRADGYHELAMINARLGLADTISVVIQPVSLPIEKTLTTDAFTITGAYKGQLLNASENSVTKAISLFEEHILKSIVGSDNLRKSYRLSIELEKNIPAGGGLGGGSSDAASILLCLWDFFFEQKKIEVDAAQKKILKDRLFQTALVVGADVPFFMHQVSVGFVTGIGEVVSTAFNAPHLQDSVSAAVEVLLNTKKVILFFPDFGISTAGSFKQYKELALPFSSTNTLKLFSNDLLASSSQINPKLQQIHQRLISICPRSGLSGSGSTFFTLDPSDSELQALYSYAAKVGASLIETQVS